MGQPEDAGQSREIDMTELFCAFRLTPARVPTTAAPAARY